MHGQIDVVRYAYPEMGAIRIFEFAAIFHQVSGDKGGKDVAVPAGVVGKSTIAISDIRLVLLLTGIKVPEVFTPSNPFYDSDTPILSEDDPFLLSRFTCD